MSAHAIASDGLSRALSAPQRRFGWDAGALLAALLIHGALLVVLPDSLSATPARRMGPVTEFVELQPPVKEAPPPPPEAVKVAETPRPPPRAQRAPKPASPPLPAPASAVLVAKEDPNAPADLTDTVVMGNSDSYVGGASSATGTSGHPVRAALPGSTGMAAAPTARVIGPDRSRHAHLAEGGSWSCPFPREADDSQIDHAVVTLRIAIDPGGRPGEIVVARDPGNGFGREARVCALAKVFAPALDFAGNPVPGSATVNVRFDR